MNNIHQKFIQIFYLFSNIRSKTKIYIKYYIKNQSYLLEFIQIYR